MGLSPSKKKDIKSPSRFSQPNLVKTVSLPGIELVREVQLWAQGYLCSNIHRTSEFEFVKNFTNSIFTHIFIIPDYYFLYSSLTEGLCTETPRPGGLSYKKVLEIFP